MTLPDGQSKLATSFGFLETHVAILASGLINYHTIEQIMNHSKTLI